MNVDFEYMKLILKRAGALLVLVLLAVSMSASNCSIEPPVQTPTTPTEQQPPSPPQPETTPPESTPEDSLPPEIEIVEPPGEVVSGDVLEFHWKGSDNETPDDDLTYSYFLEGIDSGYSPFTAETSKTYTDVPAGVYKFYVKSKDVSDNISSAPAVVEVTVISPPEDINVPPGIISSLLIVPNSEINRIVVGAFSNIIYALDSANGQLYKSEHGGYGWVNISAKIAGGAPWTGLAAAPDNPDMVAVITDSGTGVYLSTDGGNTFYNINLGGNLGPSERALCVAISPAYGSNAREVVVGTATGAGGGKIWISIIGGFASGWYDLSTGQPGWSPPSSPSSGVDVFAVTCSPAFTADGTLLAVVASTSDTYLYTGTRDLASSTVIWNNYPGYPVEVCASGQDTPDTPLSCADIALPADFNGAVAAHRHIYTCWSDNPVGVATAGNNNDDVYRVDDTICYRLNVHPDPICSLAHNGFFHSGKLLAGAMMSSAGTQVGSIQVYFTGNPQSTAPTWQRSQKPPSGSYNARVGWSPDGSRAYCGTSGIQSAFSVSTNNGLTWNQTGLIDT
jgi:hypothetical protein